MENEQKKCTFEASKDAQEMLSCLLFYNVREKLLNELIRWRLVVVGIGAILLAVFTFFGIQLGSIWESHKQNLENNIKQSEGYLNTSMQMLNDTLQDLSKKRSEIEELLASLKQSTNDTKEQVEIAYAAQQELRKKLENATDELHMASNLAEESILKATDDSIVETQGEEASLTGDFSVIAASSKDQNQVELEKQRVLEYKGITENELKEEFPDFIIKRNSKDYWMMLVGNNINTFREADEIKKKAITFGFRKDTFVNKMESETSSN